MTVENVLYILDHRAIVEMEKCGSPPGRRVCSSEDWSLLTALPFILWNALASLNFLPTKTGILQRLVGDEPPSADLTALVTAHQPPPLLPSRIIYNFNYSECSHTVGSSDPLSGEIFPSPFFTIGLSSPVSVFRDYLRRFYNRRWLSRFLFSF